MLQLFRMLKSLRVNKSQTGSPALVSQSICIILVI